MMKRLIFVLLVLIPLIIACTNKLPATNNVEETTSQVIENECNDCASKCQGAYRSDCVNGKCECYYENAGTENSKEENKSNDQPRLDKDSVGFIGSNGCQGSGIVNLTYPPRPISQIGFIEPLGLMSGNHVTPIDHQYYYPPNFKSSGVVIGDLKDVLAPADGVITSIGRMPDFFAVKNSELKDYRLVLEHTCDLYSIYIHIYKLSPNIEKEVKDLSPGNTKNVDIPVKAGELLGLANALDFSLHNDNVVLPGFINPASYGREPWKIHTVDPYDYFVEPIRSQLLEKSLRNAEPYGGKIDHDMDGKLVGNWFQEGTNGYQGVKEPQYWVTHVSFSPEGHDPSYFIVSLGDFKGEAKQFGVMGNYPNPKDVDVSSGIIKYELVDYDYVDGKGARWNRVSAIKGIKAVSANSGVYGVVLVQLIDKRKLKLEIFPDKKGPGVSGFTSNALIYVR